MTARQLPSHPDLEQLKRQAKDLLRSAWRHDSGARARFRILPRSRPGPMRRSTRLRSPSATRTR